MLLALLLIAAGGLRVGYATGELHGNRFEDERYSLANVGTIYTTGDLEPASGYYPSPVFNLPQVWALRASDAAWRATGDERLRVLDASRGWLPATYLWTRLYQTLCGIATLWFVFVAARRFAGGSPGGTRVGLLAALLLAFAPWMIHSSGYNKPDSLLVMGVAAAFAASLWTIDRGRRAADLGAGSSAGLGPAVASGLAIAIAMSAKLTGGLSAIPLVVGTLTAAWTERRTRPQALRRLGLLVVAGVSSAVAFVLANPYWPAYLHFVRGLQRDYAGRTEDSKWAIPAKVLGLQMDDLLFGPWIGIAVLVAWIALAWIVVRRLRSKDSPPGEAPGTSSAAPRSIPSSAHGVMLLAFPIVYTVAYAAQTAYFKPNNFLPLAPASAIAGGWLLDRIWRALADRLRDRGVSRGLRRGLGAVASLGLVVVAATPGWLYVYRSRVPTTLDVARLWAEQALEPSHGRLVLVEAWEQPDILWEGAQRFHHGLSALSTEPDLLAAGPERLERADGVIFRRIPANGRLGDLLVRAAPDRVVETIEPSLFQQRGPALHAVLNLRRRVEPVEALAMVDCRAGGAAGCLEAPLPAGTTAGEEVSIFALLPFTLLADGDTPELVIGSDRLPLHWTGPQRGGHLFVSSRIALPSDARSVRFERPTAFGASATGEEASNTEGLAVQLHRWRSPASQPASASDPAQPANSQAPERTDPAPR